MAEKNARMPTTKEAEHNLPILLGIVEPSDKRDIIFHHANEMTNTVVCHFCPYLAACLILKAFLTQLFFGQFIFLFQG